jgi:eukaryotic-like serine/threonine-protein kinase
MIPGSPDGHPVERRTGGALAGRTIGSYEVLSLIDAGGMGEVYLARDAKLERHVALKLLAPHLGSDDLRLHRFRDEARAASSLNHPNILVVHDFGEFEGRPYMVTEFVEGQTLRQRLQRGGLGVREALDIAVQLAGALAVAHARGIVHRDIKPENVMVRPDGYVKVLDFGLAKLMPSTIASREGDTVLRTEPGIVLGTPLYMSPEQVRGLDLDARSDVWSAGVTLHEMIAGRAPFAGATASDVMAAVLRHTPAPLRSINPGVPGALERIVAKTLEKERLDRHSSGRELLDDLRPLLRDLDPAALETNARTAATPPAPRRAKRTPRRRAIKSVVVLPLTNVSGNPQDDYFSDGMTEALIANLAQLSALRVVSSTSAMRYKNTGKLLPEIARELSVDAVLEGSVLASGGRVRISAQLIDASTDKHVWAGSYQRDLADVLALQNEVSRSIANEIRLTSTPRERARLRRARQVDPEAYQLYLRGRFHWHKRNEENVRRAVDYFTQALARDPGLAEAHAGLADSYLLLGLTLGVLPGRDWVAIARASAERALVIDDRFAGAHNSLAFAKLQQWDWAGAGREFDRALQLNPNDAVTHNWHANYLAALGQFDAAIDAARRAIALDPLALAWNMGLGHFYYLARRYDEAIAQELRTLEMDPAFYMTHWILGLSYEQKGRLADSIAALEQAVRGSGSTGMQGLLGRAYALAGHTAEAARLLGELSARAERHYVPLDALAMIHAGLGDRDRAIDLLVAACDTPSHVSLFFINVSPVYDSLRSHRRFAELLRCANLEES